MAAVAAGQVTRARAFMKRVYDLDRDSKFVVIKERGTLEDVVIPGPRTVVLDVDMGSAPLKGVRRIIWESQHVAGLVSRHEASVYLTFSHFLPPGVTCPVRIVGVSNMAPFSREAIDSDDLGGRLRLRLLRRLIVNSARRASHVIALSGACRDALVGSGVDGRRILVLSNGCDDFLEDLSGTTAAETVAAPHKPYVLCVSHFYPYKNFEVLIEGFALLDATLRERYELVIVGAPMIRKYHQRITRRVAELAGHCRIIILPGVPHTELPGLYRCATAFAFPSLVENCPNALLEAMSAGLPMVVVSRDPMPEFAGDAALFFDPHSPQELARCLGNLLEDESLRERLGRLAVERAGRYRWDDLVRGAVGAYSEACSAVGRPT